MRVLITGSRTWCDWALIVAKLIDLPDDTVVVHGDCPSGADRIADRIAKGCGYEVESHPADWRMHGRRAGFVRNAHMVKLDADVCFAFVARCVRARCSNASPHGSHGAMDCATLAEGAGVLTEYVRGE